MATKPRKPWSFEDGPEVAERIQQEYARWRLGTLPVLPYLPQQSDALLEGYKRLEQARSNAGRKVCSLTDERLITTRAAMRNEQRIAWAVWDIVHRHFIAAELTRLKAAARGRADELQLVLMAEHAVEELTVDIDAYRL